MINKKEFSTIDIATDELAEVLADFDLGNSDLIKVRNIIKNRVENAQKLLLKLIRK